jgi:hypothetical protein
MEKSLPDWARGVGDVVTSSSCRDEVLTSSCAALPASEIYDPIVNAQKERVDVQLADPDRDTHLGLNGLDCLLHPGRVLGIDGVSRKSAPARIVLGTFSFLKQLEIGLLH